MSRHGRKKRTAYRKRRKRLPGKKKCREYLILKHNRPIDPIKKVEEWLRSNESWAEKHESVSENVETCPESVETYSEQEERFKNENIKNDSLYKSFKQFCIYSALKIQVANNFRKMDI